MEIDYTTLTLGELESIYQKAEAELRQALLNGISWEEVKTQRDIVTQVAIVLHKRQYPLHSGTPADTPFRRS